MGEGCVEHFYSCPAEGAAVQAEALRVDAMTRGSIPPLGFFVPSSSHVIPLNPPPGRHRALTKRRHRERALCGWHHSDTSQNKAAASLHASLSLECAPVSPTVPVLGAEERDKGLTPAEEQRHPDFFLMMGTIRGSAIVLVLVLSKISCFRYPSIHPSNPIHPLYLPPSLLHSLSLDV